jgi:hypothetical protein
MLAVHHLRQSKLADLTPQQRKTLKAMIKAELEARRK